MQQMPGAYMVPAVQNEMAQAGMPVQAVPPEYMQSMQGMPMQMMMGPMGPMQPGMMMMAMPAGTAGGAAPQVTQMLLDAARGGRSSNIFFKTRICNKWRAGSCPYDSRCTYAHGEHELRYVPPEIVAQLEAQQKMQEAMAARSGGGGGMEQQQPRREEGGGPSLGGGPGGPGSQQTYYKTRLCIKYMQTGSCHKGSACTFAHGYEDLRQPGAPLSPGRMGQDPMSPGRMGMSPNIGVSPSMGMMQGGMQGGGHAMMMGMPPGAMGGRGMPMPVPVPMGHMGMQGMPPPQGRYLGQQQMQQRSPRSGGGYGGHSAGQRDDAAAARRRAAAFCQVAGVGEVGAEDPHPTSIQAATEGVRSGAAFRESAYADSVTDFVRTPQQQQQQQQ